MVDVDLLVRSVLVPDAAPLADRAPSPDNPLAMSVQFVRGMGPKRAALFERLGVRTVEDLLLFAPRDYLERTAPISIIRVQPDRLVTVTGTVQQISFKTVGRGRTLLTIVVGDDTAVLKAVWFNQPFRAEHFHEGDRVVLCGKAALFGDALQMNSPDYEVLEPDAPAQFAEGIVAVYPATEGLTQNVIRKIVRECVERYGDALVDAVPESIRTRDGLVSLKQAVAHVHFPPAREAAQAARRRLKFDELFTIQLGLALRRRRIRTQTAAPIPVTAEIDARIRRLFGFTLTAAQERVIAEVRADLAEPRPMNRLLQGDVGSGKTVIAVYAMLAAVANQQQAAVMAPTAILAEQHFAAIERMLAHSRVRRALLVGGASAAKRRANLAAIAKGEVDIVVGTHAVIQKDVAFARLGAVVIDEQHKFGVAQRATLRKKGPAPHCLVMTATPIPRTLAMTAFGDLDLSVLDEMPPGRRPVQTWHVPREKTAEAFAFIRSEIKRGRQAYFVYPLIEEQAPFPPPPAPPRRPTSDPQRRPAPQPLFPRKAAGASQAETHDDADAAQKVLKSAEEMHRRLSSEIYPDLAIGLLHGRMSPEEKDRVMAGFRTRRLHVLVSTVVIEVGIDVPNATLMVIEHAERFGLAQLHQLRGRIGRGRYQGYCLLFADPSTDEARQRIAILTQTADGFRIAEEDLRLRGPGEFLGARQHGLTELRLASLIDDADLLRLARKEAFDLVVADPTLAAPDLAPLRAYLKAKLAPRPGLTPIG
jgi:ATP-dependent DNA helicase RecG